MGIAIDCMFVGGFVAIVVGLSMVSLPVALIFSGFSLMIFAWLAARRFKK